MQELPLLIDVTNTPVVTPHIVPQSSLLVYRLVGLFREAALAISAYLRCPQAPQRVQNETLS